jgi:hypothetical protein
MVEGPEKALPGPTTLIRTLRGTSKTTWKDARTLYFVFGVLAGLGFGPDGAGCGQSTGMVFGWGL